MFDYQAGEKYKITLIMVALAGLMAGAFFTILLSSSGTEPARTRPRAAYMDDPDINGGRAISSAQTSTYARANSQAQPSQASLAVPLIFLNLFKDWYRLPG